MVYNQLPRILPPLGDAPVDRRTLFMMPLSSIHLCYCTEVRQALLRNSSGRRRRIAKLNLRNETENPHRRERERERERERMAKSKF